MRHRSSRWLWALPLTLLGGCLLPSFENVKGTPNEGEAGSDQGGTAGSGSGGLGGESSAGAPHAGAGGDEPRPGEPELLPDSYIVEQGKSLTISARSGVLSNDVTPGLVVTNVDDTDSNRPKAYDAMLSIASDGAVSFKAAPGFFGRYVAHYTALAPDGGVADTEVIFVVQPSSVDLSSLAEGVGGVVLNGSAEDELGVSITGLGDVNADGLDDFAVGAPGFDGGAGAVYVVFGRRDFGALELGALDGQSKETRFSVLAGSGSQRIGRYLATAGDYDGDQLRDVLIGDPAGGETGSETDGALHVVFGAADFGPLQSLDGLGQRGVTIRGKQYTGQQLGSVVAGGGDFDGDQQADLLTGFFKDGDPTKSLALLLAPPTGPRIDDVEHALSSEPGSELPLTLCFAGDVTGDGNDDILASSHDSVVLLPGSTARQLAADAGQVEPDGSDATHPGFRRARSNGAVGASIAPAGDLNGDAQQDLFFCDQIGGKATCELFFGPLSVGRTLDDDDRDWSIVGFAPAPVLPLVSGGRDLNQDDLADLVLADEGSAYVVFGRDAGFGQVQVNSLGDDGFSLAAPAGGSISAVATIGDVNGDGYGDFAVGDATASRVYVVFGGPYAAAQR